MCAHVEIVQMDGAIRHIKLLNEYLLDPPLPRAHDRVARPRFAHHCTRSFVALFVCVWSARASERIDHLRRLGRACKAVYCRPEAVPKFTREALRVAEAMAGLR